MYSYKKVNSMVSNPQEIEDKGFLSASNYLQFEILVHGDVQSSVQRKDQDFTDLHKHLTMKYPNALIPHIDNNL